MTSSDNNVRAGAHSAVSAEQFTKAVGDLCRRARVSTRPHALRGARLQQLTVTCHKYILYLYLYLYFDVFKSSASNGTHDECWPRITTGANNDDGRAKKYQAAAGRCQAEEARAGGGLGQAGLESRHVIRQACARRCTFREQSSRAVHELGQLWPAARSARERGAQFHTGNHRRRHCSGAQTHRDVLQVRSDGTLGWAAPAPPTQSPKRRKRTQKTSLQRRACGHERNVHRGKAHVTPTEPLGGARCLYGVFLPYCTGRAFSLLVPFRPVRTCGTTYEAIPPPPRRKRRVPRFSSEEIPVGKSATLVRL